MLVKNLRCRGHGKEPNTPKGKELGRNTRIYHL